MPWAGIGGSTSWHGAGGTQATFGFDYGFRLQKWVNNLPMELSPGYGSSGRDDITSIEFLEDPIVFTQPYYHRTGGVPHMRIGRHGAIFGRSW